MTGCNIVKSGTPAFFASSCSDPSTVILAEDNWWGASDSAGIEAVVYHNADYSSSPVVDFVPWANGAFCDCPWQCDLDEDGFLTALDLGAAIDIMFAGAFDQQDLRCVVPRADFDGDGFSTALDLGGLIDHLFAGGSPPLDPCVK